MKKTILSLAGFILAVWSFAGTEQMPKPFLELKLNGTLKNTGTGEFTVSKLRPDNLGWKKGRNNGKSFFFNNDLRNPGSRGRCSALVIPDGSKKCDTAEPFTVAMWIMPDPAVASRTCILFTGFSGDFGSGIKILLNGRNVVVMEYGQGTRKTLGAVRGAKMTVQPDVWSHVAVTYDKKVCRLYINGILCEEKKSQAGDGQFVRDHDRSQPERLCLRIPGLHVRSVLLQTGADGTAGHGHCPRRVNTRSAHANRNEYEI